jgi:hypothetical protein
MVKPSELLKDFSMLGIRLNDAFISISCTTMLSKYKGKVSIEKKNCSRSSVVRKRIQSGTKCRRVQEDLGDCEECDRSMQVNPRICLAACR